MLVNFHHLAKHHAPSRRVSLVLAALAMQRSPLRCGEAGQPAYYTYRWMTGPCHCG